MRVHNGTLCSYNTIKVFSTLHTAFDEQMLHMQMHGPAKKLKYTRLALQQVKLIPHKADSFACTQQALVVFLSKYTVAASL